MYLALLSLLFFNILPLLTNKIAVRVTGENNYIKCSLYDDKLKIQDCYTQEHQKILVKKTLKLKFTVSILKRKKSPIIKNGKAMLLSGSLRWPLRRTYSAMSNKKELAKYLLLRYSTMPCSKEQPYFFNIFFFCLEKSSLTIYSIISIGFLSLCVYFITTCALRA